MNKTEKKNLELSIEILGGQSATARLHGVKQQSVYLWLKHGIPLKRIINHVIFCKGRFTANDFNKKNYPK